MTVKFEDNSVKVKGMLNDGVIAALREVSGELASAAASNTRVDTGQTKGAWDYKVDEGAGVATIGNPLENAIYEEFGTGEYALNGDGRKGGWYVPEGKLSANAKGKMQKRVIKGKVYYFTRGKTPSRAFWKAYTSSKTKIIKRLEQVIGGKMK